HHGDGRRGAQTRIAGESRYPFFSRTSGRRNGSRLSPGLRKFGVLRTLRGYPLQKNTVRFLVINTFWSSTILRRAIRQPPSSARRSRSSRLPTRKLVSVATRLR